MDTFLFGAGASFGSGPCFPHPPPLGSGLFRALSEFGGIASEMPPALQEVFENNFELGMAQLYANDPAGAYRLLRDMSRFFVVFEPSSMENLYIRLIGSLLDSNARFTLATTNYDCLIEHSICHLGQKIDFMPDGANVPLFKLHGSCSFLPHNPGLKIRNHVSRASVAVIESPVRVAVKQEEVIEFCMEEDSIAPVIAMYAEGKPARFCPRFVENQQKAWQEAVADAQTNYVIGLAVNQQDQHIWDHLASAPGEIFYVAHGEEESFTQWKVAIGKQNAAWQASTFEEALPLIVARLRQR